MLTTASMTFSAMSAIPSGPRATDGHDEFGHVGSPARLHMPSLLGVALPRRVCLPRRVAFPRRACLPRLAGRIDKKAEELRIGLEQHAGVAMAQARFVGLHRAVEG